MVHSVTGWDGVRCLGGQRSALTQVEVRVLSLAQVLIW